MFKKVISFTLTALLIMTSIVISPLSFMDVYAGEPDIPAGYTTDENQIMAYNYTEDGTFDIYGFNNSWLQTTFGSDGFESYIKCDDETEGMCINASKEGKDVNGFNVKISFTFANEGKLLGIVYTVKNNNETEKKISLGSCADVQIGDDDDAVITPFGDGSGFKMVNVNGEDVDSQFNFFGKGCLDGTDVDEFWYGEYDDNSDTPYYYNQDTYTFKSTDESKSGDFDSAMSYSWQNRTIKAGETQTYKVYIGIGGKGSESAGGQDDAQLEKCTVTFESQETTFSEVQVTKDSTISTTTNPVIEAMPIPPDMDEYDFNGWYTGKNGTGTQFTKNTIVSDDITVYAYWIKPIIISGVLEPENPEIPDIPDTPEQNDKDTTVTIGGEDYEIGKESTSEDITTVIVDTEKFNEIIKTSDKGSEVIIPVSNESNKTVAQFVVQNVDNMAENELTLVVKVGDVSYNIPTKSIDTESIVNALGGKAEDIPVYVTIEKSDANTQATVNSIASQQGFNVIVKPIEFTVKTVYNGESLEVEKFKNYVARDIEITSEQAKNITTAIVTEADGSVRHVPTYVYSKDNKYFAKINSRTNSVYTLIHNDVAFNDVANKWYKDTVNEMASREIINGKDNNKFAGEDNITRAEFAAIITRALGLPSNSNLADRFTDVSKDAWYYGAVGTAYEYGLVKGKDANQTVFDPMAKITRQEAMAMIQRAAEVAEYIGKDSTVLTGFNDLSKISSWAEESVEFNVTNGFIIGSNGQIKPTENITRAEAATVILRLLQKSNLVDIRTIVD